MLLWKWFTNDFNYIVKLIVTIIQIGSAVETRKAVRTISIYLSIWSRIFKSWTNRHVILDSFRLIFCQRILV